MNAAIIESYGTGSRRVLAPQLGSTLPEPSSQANGWACHGTVEHGARFKNIAEQHPLWDHPFVQRCRSERLRLPEVRALGVQMYKFSREFSRFLARALAACPHEDARMVIAENLWEELGEGEPDRAHPALFRRFTRALGIDDASLESSPAEPETVLLINTYFDLADRYGLLGLLGAICYASEGIVATLYAQLEKGILHAAPFEREALVFFDLHVRVDDGHAARLESVLAPLLQTPDVVYQVEQAVREALDVRYRFFDGVLRAAGRELEAGSVGLMKNQLLNESGVLDQGILDSIRRLQRKGQPNVLDKVIDLYLKSSDPLLQALRDAIAHEDASRMTEAAHSLKSASANLGAVTLASLCAELEARGGAEDTHTIADILHKLEFEYQAVCRALAAERGMVAA